MCLFIVRSMLSNSLNKMRNALKEEEKRRNSFIMGITHDLKTPLALIRINAEAIEDGIAANPEDEKHFAHIITSKVDELEGMINSLLDYIRMDPGKIVLNLQMTNLHSFLSSYVERITIDGELLHHKVESRINLPDSMSVNMDSLLIQRALDNIIENSFHYTSEGSNLFINADLEPQTNSKDEVYSLAGPAVIITIFDNGSGINKKDLPYIFDLFYRGSASRGEHGMGMGLAVAKSIIDSHGWSIFASSETGKGAKFTITIPLYQGKR